jgi:hypothetical protein
VAQRVLEGRRRVEAVRSSVALEHRSVLRRPFDLVVEWSASRVRSIVPRRLCWEREPEAGRTYIGGTGVAGRLPAVDGCIVHFLQAAAVQRSAVAAVARALQLLLNGSRIVVLFLGRHRDGKEPDSERGESVRGRVWSLKCPRELVRPDGCGSQCVSSNDCEEPA